MEEEDFVERDDYLEWSDEDIEERLAQLWKTTYWTMKDVETATRERKALEDERNRRREQRRREKYEQRQGRL